MQLFGTSGIRRIADKDLFELALKTGLAVGKLYGSAVVGCDTRTSSDALKHAVISGLLAAGSKSYDAGIVPTPTLALAARDFQAGVMITASHNPPEYNGIKLWNPDGSAFGADQRAQLEYLILNDSLITAPWKDIKNGDTYNGAVDKHIEHIMQDFNGEAGIKVVLDCACGAASVITPYLLKKLGCEVVGINCYPSGHFPHPVEPVEENLQDLIRMTKDLGADVGIAHDGDADRMMAVDNAGRLIPGDKLLVLFAQQVGASNVVTTLDASMVCDEIGCTVRRTPVGDSFVSEELKNGGDFGGEASGAWIFPNSSLCPDGIYAAAQMVAIASRGKLSELVDNIPSYPIFRGSIATKARAIPDLSERLLKMRPVSVDDFDGIKLNFADGWLLVRPSGTEPKIRVTAEAKSEARAQQLYDAGIKIIKDCLKGSRE